MKIEYGSTRVVLLLGKFVLKFPILSRPDWPAVHFILKMGLYRYILRNKNFAPHLLTFNFFDSFTASISPLTEGVHSNWLEFYYYLKTRNKLLVPTYFSFFGLLNIQKQIVKIKIGRYKLNYPFEDLVPIIDDYHRHNSITVQIPFIHHMLKENYCWGDDNHLMMFDYGNQSLLPFIYEKGEEIHARFCKRTEV